jgi:iron complex transport system permease protein
MTTLPLTPDLTARIEAVRSGRLKRSRRRAIAIVALCAVLTALLIAMIMVGNTIYPVSDVLAVIRGEQVPGASFTVGTLRIPRALIGVLAGLAFGAAGTTFQTMLRNPLASPDVIGISSGASAAAVIALVVLHWSGTATMLVALVAGVVTAAAIYAAARGDESSGGRLILIGIGIGAMLDAVVQFLVQRASEWDVSVAMRWLTGSLNGVQPDRLWPLVAGVVVLVPIVLAVSRSLRALELGEASATALGVSVGATRVTLIIAAVALACVATATTGPIAFVALLSGPIAARIVGAGSPAILPAGLVGACLVLAADLIGQFAFDTAFPVGVITGIVGAPYLLFLLIRMSRNGGSS